MRRSLAATGGILLGPDYHLDLTRPGIGLYGGLPFAAARPVVTPGAAGDPGPRRGAGRGRRLRRRLDRRRARRASPPSPPATPTGSLRALGGGGLALFAGERRLPAGRAGVDGPDHRRRHRPRPRCPDHLEILNDRQTVDDLAGAAGTIGYEILTSLGDRYERVYKEAPQPPDACMILLRLLQAFLASIGRSTLGLLGATGRLTIFAATALSHLVRPPFYPRELGRQLLRIGYFSLPVVGLTALFTGAALALQIYAGGARFNAGTVVPSIVAIGIVRELGPVLGGLMVAGRVSSSIAAELGTMRVTEQIDALTTLSTDPMKYLVLPRVLAGADRAAGAGRGRRRHRRLRRLSGRHHAARLQPRRLHQEHPRLPAGRPTSPPA